MNTHAPSFGTLLQSWRQRRRYSQLALASDAGISQRHLSFVETGRSRPSRDMVLHLAERLDVPPRDRNTLLVAAGFAPLLKERGLHDPDMAAARRAVEAILMAHEPNPALAIDRHWGIVSMNQAIGPLVAGVAPQLLGDAPNALRLSLHPNGLARRIRNYRDWRNHVLRRLQRQIDAVADPVLAALAQELADYPIPPGAPPATSAARLYGGLAVPLELILQDGRLLRLISTTTIFGTAIDISLSEIAIESFFPSDAATGELLASLAR